MASTYLVTEADKTRSLIDITVRPSDGLHTYTRNKALVTRGVGITNIVSTTILLALFAMAGLLICHFKVGDKLSQNTCCCMKSWPRSFQKTSCFFVTEYDVSDTGHTYA